MKATAMPEASFAYIPLDLLTPNAYNARRFIENMTPQRLARFNELVASVREKRIIEPLLVRPIDGGRFEIIAGERRYRAALEVVSDSPIKDYQVPCMVRDVGDDDAFDLMIIENMQRDDLTPFETAQAFADYLGHHGNKAEAVATLSLRTGIPAHAIRRQVRLLEVPAGVIAAWKDGVISMSHVELFTRVGDEQQTLELLAACQRSKLSTRELAERIGAAAPDLERGFFDKGECQVCHFNTSVQSGLFPDASPGGKCGNAACFEVKQAAFLTENWQQSKAASMFITQGFRFGHRAPPEMRQLLIEETAERCKTCDTFISLLRLTGVVISGYERTCIGPRTCFDELYRVPAAAPVVETETGNPDESDKSVKPDGMLPVPAVEAGKTKTVEKTTAAPPVKTQPVEETGPVYNAQRGEKARESFIRVALPPRVKESDPGDNQSLRLLLLSLALASPAAKSLVTLAVKLPANCKPEQLAEKIFDDLPGKDVLEELQTAALAQLLDHGVAAAVRRVVAANFGIDIRRDFALSADYLESLTKSEIVRVGEEPRVDVWRDEKLEAYRKEHHKGKALMSLSKRELVELVMKSGIELAGRVPAEVVGK